MRVLIAGCGYVGTALGLRLAEQGHEVLGLRRSATALPDAITPVAADLTRADTLRGLPPIDVVAITASPASRDVAQYRSAYLTAPRTLLAVLAHQQHPVRRVALTSSTTVYGQHDGQWVDEASPTSPTTATGRVVLEAEGRVLAGPFPAVVLRLSGIYGPGRTRLIDQVRRGEATCGEVPSFTNRIHRDDCASALAHLLTLPDPAAVYLGTDDDSAPRCQVLNWLAQRLDAPPPRRVPGAGIGRAGSKRCRNDRLKATGWTPTYPSFRDGYAAMLATTDPAEAP